MRATRRPPAPPFPSQAISKRSRSKARPLAAAVSVRWTETLSSAPSLRVRLAGTSSKRRYPSGCQAGPSPNWRSPTIFSHWAPAGSRVCMAGELNARWGQALSTVIASSLPRRNHEAARADQGRGDGRIAAGHAAGGDGDGGPPGGGRGPLARAQGGRRGVHVAQDA